MTLRQAASEAFVDPIAIELDAEVRGICADSRRVRPGDIYVAMPSSSGESWKYLVDARDRGASAFVVNTAQGAEICHENHWPFLLLGEDELTFIRGIAGIAQHVLGDPTASLRVIGITGTNGKTTTAWIMHQALGHLGRKAAYLGTIGYHGLGNLQPNPNTTPFPVEVLEFAARAHESGMTDLVMEVSSHALHQNRVRGIRFDAGVFMNLTQDHLDYHGTMDEYAEAKKLLFTSYSIESDKPFTAVMNSDDPIARTWLEEWADAPAAYANPLEMMDPMEAVTLCTDPGMPERPSVVTFGQSAGDFHASDIQVEASHTSMTIHHGPRTAVINAALGGSFNTENLLAAVSTLTALGHDLDEVCAALSKCTAVPGRFEAIENDKGIGVIVDYAHTPDAFVKLLNSARELTSGKLTMVFGCGGDRDQEKRPLMAKAASELADIVYVTLDNPRTEDPKQIFDQTLAGIVEGAEVHVIDDRTEAINSAISRAHKGDVVVIAGKGHETYQIIGKDKHHFDDREAARAALAVHA